MRNFALPLELRRYFPTNGAPPHLLVDQNKALFLDLDLFFVKVNPLSEREWLSNKLTPIGF